MFGFLCDFRKRSSWRFTCGIIWNHKCRGKLSAVRLSTLMKWSFQVWITFSAMLCQWSSVGVNWYVIFDSSISDLYALNILLSKTWSLGTSPGPYLCEDELPFSYVLNWFNPCIISVHLVKDDLVPVATAWHVRKISCFISVNIILHVIYCDKDIMFLEFQLWRLRFVFF